MPSTLPISSTPCRSPTDPQLRHRVIIKNSMVRPKKDVRPTFLNLHDCAESWESRREHRDTIFSVDRSRHLHWFIGRQAREPEVDVDQRQVAEDRAVWRCRTAVRKSTLSDFQDGSFMTGFPFERVNTLFSTWINFSSEAHSLTVAVDVHIIDRTRTQTPERLSQRLRSSKLCSRGRPLRELNLQNEGLRDCPSPASDLTAFMISVSLLEFHESGG